MMHPDFILSFLRELQRNNSKQWMDLHREHYLQARQYFVEIVEHTLTELVTLDPSLHGVTAQESVFRINKNDFSKKGEPPYKGRIGAGMSKGGRHSAYANYILVLEPGGKSRVGGGMRSPGPKQLELIRQEIDYSPGELEAIVQAEDFRKQYGMLQGEKLSMAPKGYTSTHPAIDLLKHKGFLALHYFTDEEVCTPGFTDRLLPFFKAVKPLHDFLNRTIN
ncbi:DUF2461 domain-containing protein [Pontibacter ruber]|uniref:DUF2461 domain-containing protein n=1 Tax=Pontibacter ruber TaxID=1343895 RepID=A0ABW5CUZ5_9BACT|nr:DUF2461 domain-containing protein [Pontibacter ruber]